MIAVGYLRCSTDKQERSAAEQWGEIRKYCTKRGYTLLPEPYVDEGWSGDDPDRPDFNRLLRDCSSRACPFDVIVVFDQGRFSRSDTDTATVIFVLLRDSDIRLESVTEGVIVDPNSQDELSQSLSRAVNQYAKNKFLKDLAYSVARSRVSLAKRGVFGGPPPYGTRTRSDGRLERDPPKARIVQLIFRWLLSGWTLNAIVRRLNTEGVPSPWKERIGRGKWSSAAIKLILRNPVYYGHRVFGRTRRGRHVTIDGDSLVPVPRQMQGKKRKGTAGIVPEVPVWSGKPIVDVHSWQEAQKIVDAPSKKNLRNTRSLPLVGIARCGFCGSRMFSQRCKRAEGKGRPAKTWTYYRCPNTSGSSSVTPDHQHDFCGIPADVLWSATVRAVEEYLSDERIADVCKEVDRSLRSARSHERQSRPVLKKRISQTEKRRETVKQNMLYAAGPEAVAAFAHELAERTQELHALRAELAALDAMQSEAASDSKTTVDEVRAWLRRIRDQIHGPDAEEAIRLLVKEVIVHAVPNPQSKATKRKRFLVDEIKVVIDADVPDHNLVGRNSQVQVFTLLKLSWSTVVCNKQGQLLPDSNGHARASRRCTPQP